MPQIYKSRPHLKGLALTKMEEFSSPLPDGQKSVHLPVSRNQPPSPQNSVYPDEGEGEVLSGKPSRLTADPLNKLKYEDKAFFGSAPVYQPPYKTELPHSGEKKDGVPRNILEKLRPKKLKSSTSSCPSKQPYDEMILPSTVPTYQSLPKSEIFVQMEESKMTTSTNMKPSSAPTCDYKCYGESQSKITKELPLTPELSFPKKVNSSKSKKPVVMDPKPLSSSSDKPISQTQIEFVAKGSTNQRKSYQGSSVTSAGQESISESSLDEVYPGCFGLK
ncbi:unnamed protein product [Calicophoron daubneyi]|uniref:Uncharacterized protein n=1 Tax=Calicophoron daubneyi TaxID=300641 RepID=A0AAV2TH40_CALDB